MMRKLRLLTLLLAPFATTYSCSNTESGNPPIDDTLTFAVFTNDSQKVGLRGDEGSVRIDEVWTNVHRARLIESDACEAERGADVRIEDGLSQLVSEAKAFSFGARATSYCRLRVELQQSEQLAEGAPAQMTDHVFVATGERDDGVPFRLQSISADLLDKPFDAPIEFSDEASTLAMRLDASRWFEPGDLEAAEVDENGVITISPERYPELLAKIEPRIRDSISAQRHDALRCDVAPMSARCLPFCPSGACDEEQTCGDDNTCVPETEGSASPPDTSGYAFGLNNVSDIKSEAGEGWIRLSWRLPDNPHARVMVQRSHVEIAESVYIDGRLRGKGARVDDGTVYEGRDSGFLDRRVVLGSRYNYDVSVVDHAQQKQSGSQGISALPYVSFSAVSASNGRSAALSADGRLWTFGRTGYGVAGLGDCEPGNINGCPSHSRHLAPLPVGSETTWTAVATGPHHTLASRADGSLWAWGYNWHGQLGLDCDTSLSTCMMADTPQRVGGDADWAAFDAGDFFSAAIKRDGSLWVWGSNNSGVYGDACRGSESCREGSQSTPQRVPGSTTWRAVSCGLRAVLAIADDGSLWGWGWGFNGTTLGATQSTPLRLSSSEDWVDVSASASGGQRLALKSDGSVWSIPASDTPKPEPIWQDKDWMLVEMGKKYVTAIKRDGTLWAWGSMIPPTTGGPCPPTQDTCDNFTEPTQIDPRGGWFALSSDGDGTYFALRHDEAGGALMYGWGLGKYGALGLGSGGSNLATHHHLTLIERNAP